MNYTAKQISQWASYYAGRVGPGYAKYADNKYSPFLDAIEQAMSEQGGKLALREEGCGIGTISRILLGYYPWLSMELIDSCPDMLELAMLNVSDVPGSGKVVYREQDLTDESMGRLWTRPGIIHSHGVLEHMDDETIQAVLDRQTQQAPRVIHYVPTNGYDEPSFGDERLLPVEYWVDTFKPDAWMAWGENDCDLWLQWGE